MKTYMDVLSTLRNLNEKCADAKSCYDDAKKNIDYFKRLGFPKADIERMENLRDQAFGVWKKSNEEIESFILSNW